MNPATAGVPSRVRSSGKRVESADAQSTLEKGHGRRCAGIRGRGCKAGATFVGNEEQGKGRKGLAGKQNTEMDR